MLDVSPTERASLLAVAEAVADAARAEALRHFRQAGLVADNKLDTEFDPVTIADRNAEQAMRKVLAELRPDDAVLGEEFGLTEGTSGLTWVLDPIDGTRSYISGTPTWGVLIAVGGQNGPVLGIVDQPYIGERFLGGLGEAWVRGPLGTRPLKTRLCAALSEATLFTTFPEVGTEREGAGFRAVADQVKLTRYGTDCYAYALIAAGQVDLVIEAGLNSYDIQGPMAVVEAAGGIVTNWQGDAVHEGGQVLAAGSKELHEAALAILRDYAKQP